MNLSRFFFAVIVATGLSVSAHATVVTVFDDDFQNRADDGTINFGNLNANVSVGSYRTSGLGGGATYQDDGIPSDIAALFDGFSTGATIAAQLDLNGDGNGGGGSNAGDTVSFSGLNSISATWDAQKRRTGNGKDYTWTFQQNDGAVISNVFQVKWLNGGQVNVLVDDGTGAALTFDTKVYDPVSYPNKSDQNGSETWKPAGTADGAWQFSVDFSADLAVVQVTDDEGNSDGAFNIDLSGIGLAQEFEQMTLSVTGGSGMRGMWMDNVLITANVIPEPSTALLLGTVVVFSAARGTSCRKVQG